MCVCLEINWFDNNIHGEGTTGTRDVCADVGQRSCEQASAVASKSRIFTERSPGGPDLLLKAYGRTGECPRNKESTGSPCASADSRGGRGIKGTSAGGQVGVGDGYVCRKVRHGGIV